ncbi:glycogen debranching protein GlgX [Streptomyces sp. HNM0575]|uniref:glycogen debranching protein GlgX n=1 Tax=Streptomyces sp. HNM0575 TaxID=2716338 RepID=UPI00145C582F|nr:glycogen debranching protein GlgX [Streptomyces sp. HNM0575]NLU76731.1 glycogen debranching protein GlgX [Streptomyces sp. HNM0575]
MQVWPGDAYPLGATYDGAGTNFAVFSEAAHRVELCLLDEAGRESRVELREHDGHVRHAYLPGVGPGQRYGFRVHGPYEPGRGLLCNAAKLLLDPYAKAMSGSVEWHEALYGHRFDDPDVRNDLDSAPYTMTSVVIDPGFDWGDDRPPRTSPERTVVYEAHVKGLTMLHPGVPPELRGTYAALGHPAVVGHLKQLGVTALELMPVHQSVTRQGLAGAGLADYWGYNTIGFFAPHDAYASRGELGGQVREFKQAVRALHDAGIEVLLDVVYNHTAEGGHLGPTLSFRGLDNPSYYRLGDDPRYCTDTTGTGNSLLMRSPHVLQLIMDSLRYWVTEMHVDGFRFDLAATLARQFHEVDRRSSFFDLVQQDPVVSRVKLIAEPWDVGENGYQAGNFPPLWSEWNGRYRDTVRDLWRGEPGTLPGFASRLTGSSDLFRHGRRPTASVNFVTCHDGFTLHDLVAYDGKHNEANGEDGRDGEDHNRSWNCGAEGPTGDPDVQRLRRRQMRNLVATLMLSQGVPMLSHGDEFGRTQRGNNNAYCHDGELTWVHWPEPKESGTRADGGDADQDSGAYPDGGAADRDGGGAYRDGGGADPDGGGASGRELRPEGDLFAFVCELTALRRRHPVFRRRRFLRGSGPEASDDAVSQRPPDIAWFTPAGKAMTDADWHDESARSLTVLLDGGAIPEPDRRGEPVTDDSFLLLFNAHAEAVEFTVPHGPGSRPGDPADGRPWRLVLDTAAEAPPSQQEDRAAAPGERIALTARSMAVLRLPYVRTGRAAPAKAAWTARA